MTAALKMAKRDYERMAIAELRELAWQGNEDHEDEATRMYVKRLADLAFERLRHMDDHGPGWHPSSPGFGDGTGKSTAPTDAMYLAHLKGIKNTYWHDYALSKLSKLPPRLYFALMLSAGKIDSRNKDQKDLFAKSFEFMADNISKYSLILRFGASGPAGITFDCVIDEERGEHGSIVRVRDPHTVRAFKNGQAIKDAARKARAELIMQAKIGII